MICIASGGTPLSAMLAFAGMRLDMNSSCNASIGPVCCPQSARRLISASMTTPLAAVRPIRGSEPSKKILAFHESCFHLAAFKIDCTVSRSPKTSESVPTARLNGVPGKFESLSIHRFLSASEMIRGARNCANSVLAATASFLAPLAATKALDAERLALSAFICASPAASLAWAAASAAPSADVFASPACWEIKPKSASLAALISVSTFPAFTSTYNSPATPITISAVPTSPRISNNRLGLSGGWISPRLNSLRSSRNSLRMTNRSKPSPTTTRNVNTCSSPCSDERDASRLSSKVRSADSFMKQLRSDQVQAAVFQLWAVAAMFLIAIAIIIGIDLFDRYKYRNKPL